MSYIFFKMKSAQNFDRLDIDGGKMKVLQVKMEIAEKLKMSSKDFDLELTNFQTGGLYTDDHEYIPKDTSLTVTRKPVEKASGYRPQFLLERERTERVREETEDMSRLLRTGPAVGMTPVASVMSDAVNDEDRVKQLRTDEETRFQFTKLQGKGAGKSLLNRPTFGTGKGSKGDKGQPGEAGAPGNKTPIFRHGLPPPDGQPCSYCRECGHWPSQCPKKELAPKRNLVHPRSVPAAMLEACTADDQDAKYQHQLTGVIYKLKPNDEQFRSLRDVDLTLKDKIPRDSVPEDLRCPLCHELFHEAVLLSCCGETYCTACIESALDKNNRQCPAEDCTEKVSSSMMISAKRLRDMCREFRLKYDAELRRRRLEADRSAKAAQAEKRENERKQRELEKVKEKHAAVQETKKDIFDPTMLANLAQGASKPEEAEPAPAPASAPAPAPAPQAQPAKPAQAQMAQLAQPMQMAPGYQQQPEPTPAPAPVQQPVPSPVAQNPVQQATLLQSLLNVLAPPQPPPQPNLFNALQALTNLRQPVQPLMPVLPQQTLTREQLLAGQKKVQHLQALQEQAASAMVSGGAPLGPTRPAFNFGPPAHITPVPIPTEDPRVVRDQLVQSLESQMHNRRDAHPPRDARRGFNDTRMDDGHRDRRDSRRGHQHPRDERRGYNKRDRDESPDRHDTKRRRERRERKERSGGRRSKRDHDDAGGDQPAPNQDPPALSTELVTEAS